MYSESWSTSHVARTRSQQRLRTRNVAPSLFVPEVCCKVENLLLIFTTFFSISDMKMAAPLSWYYWQVVHIKTHLQCEYRLSAHILSRSKTSGANSPALPQYRYRSSPFSFDETGWVAIDIRWATLPNAVMDFSFQWKIWFWRGRTDYIGRLWYANARKIIHLFRFLFNSVFSIPTSSKLISIGEILFSKHEATAPCVCVLHTSHSNVTYVRLKHPF